MNHRTANRLCGGRPAAPGRRCEATLVGSFRGAASGNRPACTPSGAILNWRNRRTPSHPRDDRHRTSAIVRDEARPKRLQIAQRHLWIGP